MKFHPLLVKIFNIILIILEVILIVIAVESQSIIGIIALLLFNIVFAIIYVTKNWFWIRTMTDYMLGKATGYTFRNGKAMFPEKKMKVKKDGKKEENNNN